MRFGTAISIVATFAFLSYDRGGRAHAAAAAPDVDDRENEHLLRRREDMIDDTAQEAAASVYEAGRAWQDADNDRRRAAQERGDSFYRYGTDYGTDEELGRYEYSKGNKSGKGKNGKTKGGSKGKGSKAMHPYPPYDTPTYTYAPVKYPGPTPVKDPTRPPYYQPVKAPVHEPSPTPDCPDPKPPKQCIPHPYYPDRDTCEDPLLTCQKRCLPALCKVEPHGPPKYHDGHAYDPPTTYVPIGSTCKWWEYATSRGEPEICCELKEYSEYDPPGCGVCYDCQFPQVVNEACCAFHTGPPKLHDSEHDKDRSGEYEGCRDGKICCKCGPHSYKCIPNDDYHQCDETVCGFEPPPKETPMPMGRPTPSPTPEPTEPPTPGPTPNPTPGPTPEPTPEPTPDPTPRPTPMPSKPCTCEVDVDISCISPDERNCTDLEALTATANTEDCFVNVTYTYRATNIGHAILQVSNMTRTFNGAPEDKMDSLTLQPDQFAVATEIRTVELCVTETMVYNTMVQVSGECDSCLVDSSASGEDSHSMQIDLTPEGLPPP